MWVESGLLFGKESIWGWKIGGIQLVLEMETEEFCIENHSNFF